MRTIGLVSCSARKQMEAKLNPQKEFAAKDMYTGSNYKKSIEEGLPLLGCDSFCILSGKYGLLDPADKIRYYDCYLGKMNAAYKKNWSDKVYKQLQEKYGDLDQVEFIFFAGDAYCKYLKKRLNCKVLRFNHRQITFDIKEEYHA